MRVAKFNKPITIALPEKLYFKIKDISDLEKVSMAEKMRELLKRELLKGEEEDSYGV